MPHTKIDTPACDTCGDRMLPDACAGRPGIDTIQDAILHVVGPAQSRTDHGPHGVPARIGSHVCPKCGHTEFLVTAHVTQGWLVGAKGNFLKCTEECTQVTHFPSDDDLWTCAKCGYDAPGRDFT